MVMFLSILAVSPTEAAILFAKPLEICSLQDFYFSLNVLSLVIGRSHRGNVHREFGFPSLSISVGLFTIYFLTLFNKKQSFSNQFQVVLTTFFELVVLIYCLYVSLCGWDAVWT